MSTHPAVESPLGVGEEYFAEQLVGLADGAGAPRPHAGQAGMVRLLWKRERWRKDQGDISRKFRSIGRKYTSLGAPLPVKNIRLGDYFPVESISV